MYNIEPQGLSGYRKQKISVHRKRLIYDLRMLSRRNNMNAATCGLIVSTALLFAAPAAHTAPTGHTAQLTVAVAANVKYAFDELAAEFIRESGIEVRGVSGASGQLVAQIKNGAPFDVFLSADLEYPEALYREKLAIGPPMVYASGVLVLWTRKPLDLGKGISVLADRAVKKIVIADPRLAPYGRESLRALEHFKLRAAVEAKLVYGESIAQVSQYIDTGAADIGFTAKSVVLAPGIVERGRWAELPADSYEPIAQGVVILQYAQRDHAQEARRFLEFLSSPAARAIFAKYGYLLP